MKTFDIYDDITTRTSGDIYIGVVGPVRTGKSTFIRRFVEQLILPNIEDDAKRTRLIDSLPESGDGKGIMTTEPKFVPDEGVSVHLSKESNASIRLIDSVGYIVESAEGYMDGDIERYVTTPWSTEKITFGKASELGTKKVIEEHSTIGIVMTTDGSICGIDRADYVTSEERIVEDMKRLDKPFVIVLNTVTPTNSDTIALAESLESKYGVSVIALSVENMTVEDINGVITRVLYEFPLKSVECTVPSYMNGLDMDNAIVADMVHSVMESIQSASKMSDIKSIEWQKSKYISDTLVEDMDFGTGEVTIRIEVMDGLFYEIISSETGAEITSDVELVGYIKRLREAELMTERLGTALEEAESLGYGVVMPRADDVTLSEPNMVKKGGKYSVGIHLTAPSYHIIKVDIARDIYPIMGSEEQCGEMIDYINGTADGGNIMDVTLFSKPIRGIVMDEIESREGEVTQDTRAKLARSLSRIVNEGKGGVLCVLI